MAQTAISDEQIIAALLTHGTIRQAAEAAGISERAIYDRMNKGDFQALYKAAKADLIRAAVFTLNQHLQDAIDVVAGIMTDKDINPATRLQAAQTIISNAAKFTQRLQDDENRVTMQVESNAFSI